MRSYPCDRGAGCTQAALLAQAVLDARGASGYQRGAVGDQSVSMMFCCRCDTLIDTDDDPDAFMPDPRYSGHGMHPDICVCEQCREMQEEEANREPPEREFSPAQQSIIDAHEATSRKDGEHGEEDDE